MRYHLFLVIFHNFTRIPSVISVSLLRCIQVMLIIFTYTLNLTKRKCKLKFNLKTRYQIDKILRT